VKQVLSALILSLLLITPAFATEWHSANQVTLGWDNPNPDMDLAFEVYQARPDRADVVLLGLTSDLQMVISVAEGRWLLGVAAVRIVDGEEVARSETAWSDMAEYTADGPFGVQHWRRPDAPGGLRVQ
jgi:hypothetical protein